MIGLRGIPSKDGGVEVAVGELSPRLFELGINCTVYCRSNYVDKNLNKYQNVSLISLPTINTKHFEAFIHTFLSSIHAIGKRFDIIHYHAGGNALFCWLPRIFGLKTVVTLHGQDWQRAKWGGFAKFILRMGEKIGVIFANNTISVSKKIVNYYPKYNLVHIPNGISNVVVEPDISILKDYELDDYILYLGRIVPEKGIDILIKAFIQNNMNEKLVIVGDTTHTLNYLKELKKISKYNKNIIFTGPLFNEKKEAIIKNAKLFIMPSLLEGMPIVLLEMLNAGIPCIVSDIPEIIEVVKVDDGNLCEIFKSGDIKDLSKKLIHVIADIGNYQKKAFKSKAYVRKKYNWDSIAKETKDIYVNLMSQIK